MSLSGIVLYCLLLLSVVAIATTIVTAIKNMKKQTDEPEKIKLFRSKHKK